jgi:hypothetical protein
MLGERWGSSTTGGLYGDGFSLIDGNRSPDDRVVLRDDDEDEVVMAADRPGGATWSQAVVTAPVRRGRNQCLGVALLVAMVGCSPIWKPLVPTPTAWTPDPNQRVQVWVHGHSVCYWYSVVISHDSLAGRPYVWHSDLGGPYAPSPLTSDTSRRRLALAAVDSVRLASFNPANIVMGVGVAIAVVSYVFSKNP